MTSTATRPARDPAPALRIRAARRRLHVPTTLAGLLLVVGCALAFGLLTQTLAEQRPVLVLSRPVARGAVLTEADLAVAQVSRDSTIRTLPATNREQVLGHTLLTSLPAGSVITGDLLAPGTIAVGPSTRTVGLLLDPGGYPTSSLAPGDTVSVVDTGGAGDVLDDQAVVLDSAPIVDGSATRLVSVVVDGRSAAAITAAAAQDRVGLLLHGVAQ